MREPRRGEERGVPPISTLLESADQNDTAPPRALILDSSSHNAGLSSNARYTDPSLWREVQQSPRGSRSLRASGRPAEYLSAAHSSQPERQNVRLLSAQGASLGSIDSRPEAVPRLSQGLELSPQSPYLTSHQDQTSHEAHTAERSTLPTPPQDVSVAAEVIPLNAPDYLHRHDRGWHPSRNLLELESQINGLGDRNRSPTPGEGWEIMRSTITPDETLPSAESSFTSAAASQSFGTGNETQITEPESPGLRHGYNTRNFDGLSDSASSADLEDWEVCNFEGPTDPHDDPQTWAETVYTAEMSTPDGRERTNAHTRPRAEQGIDDSDPYTISANIGYVLIEEGMRTQEGRARLQDIRARNLPNDPTNFPASAYFPRVASSRRRTQRRHRSADGPPTPHPERQPEATQHAAREASRVVRDYVSRYASNYLRSRSTSNLLGDDSPAGPDANTTISQDAPIPHPVSPPTRRHSEREVSDGLLSGDIQDLDSMRRIVERLAARADVPEEWWMSMGLNVSRDRPRDRSRSPRRAPRHSMTGNADWRRASSRTERENPRL